MALGKGSVGVIPDPPAIDLEAKDGMPAEVKTKLSTYDPDALGVSKCPFRHGTVDALPYPGDSEGSHGMLHHTRASYAGQHAVQHTKPTWEQQRQCKLAWFAPSDSLHVGWFR